MNSLQQGEMYSHHRRKNYASNTSVVRVNLASNHLVITGMLRILLNVLDWLGLHENLLMFPFRLWVCPEMANGRATLFTFVNQKTTIVFKVFYLFKNYFAGPWQKINITCNVFVPWKISPSTDPAAPSLGITFLRRSKAAVQSVCTLSVIAGCEEMSLSSV